MKRKIATVLLFAVLSTVFISNVNAEELVFDAEFGFDVAINAYPWLTTTFYSNYSNRFYAFFNYNRPAVGWTAYYSHSIDGITWSNITRLFYPDSPLQWSLNMGDWDFYLEPNGRYVHVAFRLSKYIYYFKRELFTNGSLGVLDGLTNVPQLILNQDLGAYDDPWDNVDIVLDNRSYAYITFVSNNAGGDNTGFLIDSNFSIPLNGTWNEGDFVLTEAQTVIGNVWDNDWHTIVTNNGDGKLNSTGIGRGVHWIMTYENSFGSNQEAIVSARNYYNGSGWHIDGMGDSNLADHEGGDWADNAFDVTSIGNITIYAKQTENGAVDITLSYGTRIGTRDWSNAAAVSSAYPGDAGSVQINPNVAVDYNRNVLFTWNIHHPDNSSVWYRRGVIHWNGTITWTGDEVLWENWAQTAVWDYYSVASGAAETLPDGVPMSMTYEDGNADWVFHDYLFPLAGEELDLPAQHLNTTLYSGEDLYGNPIVFDGWIFEGDIYTFESYVTGATEYNLNFTDGQHDILFRWDNDTETLDIISDERFVIGDIYTNYTLFPGGVQRFTWRFVPDINIVDEENATVYYYVYNEGADYNASGETGIETNIYNLGGLTYYNFTGDGGRTVGGTPFELYATNGSLGSIARAEQIFRKLQHINFLMELDLDNDWDAGNGEFDITNGVGWVDVGFDYRLNGTWVEGFKIRIYDQDANVGHHNAGNDHNWVEWSIDFYNYNPGTGDQQNLQSQLIYSNHWGYENENLSPDYHNRTSSQLFIDLWFDKTNASTTIASQVNSYYYGMREHGSSWWFGYGVFQPMISNYDNAKFLDDLYDEGGNVTNVQKFDLIKFYIEVGKVDRVAGNNQTWRIRAIENMHRGQAIDRMGGIDEPTFVQTKVLDMPQTGFINAIKSAINGLSKLIWGGAFQFVKLLMGAVGGLMNAIGLGEWWIAFSAMIERIAVFSMNLMEELQVALINSALLLSQIFALVGAGIGRFVGVITSVISSLLIWYDRIVQLFTGGGLLDINLWIGLNLEDFVLLAIHLLPVYWIHRLISADEFIRTLQGDLTFVVMIVTGLFNFLISIVMLAVVLFNFLLGLLPI